MKFSQFKRVLKEDLAAAGGEVPKWVDVLLQPINLFIENVALALQNRLNFSDNFFSKEVTIRFVDGSAQEVNPTTAFAKSARAYGILLLSSSGETVDNFIWTNKTNGNVSITVNFNSASDAECTFLILLR